MAFEFARALAGLADAKVQTVGSRAAASAERFARQLGIPRAYGSSETVLATPEIDVVHIPTTSPTHHELSLQSLGAGKPVLCEKPFALNAAQPRAVVDHAGGRL